MKIVWLFFCSTALSAVICNYNGECRRAWQYYIRAKEYVRTGHIPLALRDFQNAAEMYEKAKKFQSSQKMYLHVARCATQIGRKYFDCVSPTAARQLFGLAESMFRKAGRQAELKNCFNESLDILKKVQLPDCQRMRDEKSRLLDYFQSVLDGLSTPKDELFGSGAEQDSD